MTPVHQTDFSPARGEYPAFREYIAFLKAESERRAAGGEFNSKRELALVNFYRDRKGFGSLAARRLANRTREAGADCH